MPSGFPRDGLCGACGGETILRLAPARRGAERFCPDCGDATREALSLDRERLRDVAARRDRLRARVRPVAPVILLWIPPLERWADGLAMVRDRLVADDPCVLLLVAPLPESEEVLLDSAAVFADRAVLVAPDGAGAESLGRLLGRNRDGPRVTVVGADGAPLFDVASGIRAAVRRAAFDRTLAGDAAVDARLPLRDPRAARAAVVADDLAVVLLDAIAADAAAMPGGGPLVREALALLERAGAIEGAPPRITPGGEDLLRRALPPDAPAAAAADPLGDLFRRARDGNREAMGLVLRSGAEEARRIARARLGRRLRLKLDSVDISQSVIGDLLAGIDRFEYRGAESWRGYLRTLVENKIRAKADRFRAARRDLSRERALDAPGDVAGFAAAIAPSAEPDPAEAAARAEERSRLVAALAELPPDECEVLTLRIFEGRPHREIAELLGRPSEGAVHKLYARALARLAKVMGGDG